MYQSKRIIPLTLGFWLILFMFYHNIFNLLRSYTFGPYNTVYKPFYYRSPISFYKGNEDFLVDTPGCSIPNYAKTLHYKETKNYHKSCGQRAVTIQKLSNNEIKFSIHRDKFSNLVDYSTVECCYRFAYRSTIRQKENTHLTYSPCLPFHNESTAQLETEVITVECAAKTEQKHIIYEDAYIVLKKINSDKKTENIRSHSWNVLLLGMDTMSRARVFETMPRTTYYLQQHNWLDFRGYHKVAFNTFPNLMSVLTGKNLSAIYRAACDRNINECNKLMIWNKFKDAGFVTAYGEDFLELPDTFGRFSGFKAPPTDHYLRPFFLTGEKKIGNIVCAKKKPSGIHLLDFAVQLANSYKNEKLFGMIWINSFSHNIEHLPTLIDNDMVKFFEKLNNTGILNNTFIFFFSDHGIRYGEMRLPMESYFDERLPMFFMWIPTKFQELYAAEYYNLQLNQNRLTTPYDVHATLFNILKITNNSVDIIRPEGCPRCRSMFEEISPYRTCSDASINDKWCSCHNMVAIGNSSSAAEAKRSIQLAVSYIQNKTKTIQTNACSACSPLSLKAVLRIHSYKTNNKTFFVVAFVMTPGSINYEATVEVTGSEFKVLEPTDTISKYNGRGKCVKRSSDIQYCVCTKIRNCNKKHES